MGWLDIGAGAAHGLDKMLADRLAEEHWQRTQNENERRNRATEAYQMQSLADSAENRRLAREDRQAAATEATRKANVDDTRFAYSNIPMNTIIEPAEVERVTRLGALPMSSFKEATIPDRPAVASGVPESLAQNEDVFQKRGTPTEIAAERTAKALEAERNKPDHSQIYTEYQDYKREGGTLSFDAYATMDANRKKPTTPEDTAIPMDQQELDMWARQVAMGGGLPAMGSGKAGVEARHQIGRRASRYNVDTGQFEEENPNPPNLAAAGADYKANRDVLTQLSKNMAAVNSFRNTAKSNVGLLNETLATLPDSGVQFINRPYRALAETFGSTTVTNFNVIHNALKNEYARLTSQPNLTGPLTVTQQNEVKEALGEGATIGQIRAAFEILGREGDNRHAAIQQEIADTRARISPKKPSTTPPAETAETPEQRRARFKKLADEK